MRRMPAEFEKHAGTILVWPVREGSWPHKGIDAQKTFTELANIISKSETLFMCCNPSDLDHVKNIFKDNPNIRVIAITTNDAWARDIGPTFVKENNIIKGVDWKFNAWGGDFDGLYKDYEDDDRFASSFCNSQGYSTIDAHPFILEGGSIHVDGEGTLITTETCLLSKGRNSNLSRKEIESQLKNYLGVSKIIWLPGGIVGDETNEHVDNICCFSKPGEVIMSWTDDENDPQHEICVKNLEVLNSTPDAKGRKINVIKLPLPANPVVIEEEDLKGFVFEKGEDEREVGEKLAASYANFYIANDAVLLPQFEDPNDKVAVDIISSLFPDRQVYPIKARSIIVGGGNIHCITQQIPYGGNTK
ncbi:MAG: agmatine deiminase [Clostridia bacterium]|nr:agmatine deiminase [Clostridia bacterium]